MLIQTSLLSFDNSWLEPQYSEIESRSHPDLSSKLSPTVTLKHPVVASNMASVVGKKMALTFDNTGSVAFLHRFMTKELLVELASEIGDSVDHFAFSVGIKDEDYETATQLYDIIGEKSIVLVDIAHGHTKKMGEAVERIKKIGYHTVVAGNVATASGYSFLESHGADAVRVGVAGGRVCTTKHVTGHHVPTLQSVAECSSHRGTASIIADGGIATSGDAAKCLAAGADFVCLGSVLVSTSDSPGEIIHEPGGMSYKLYYGMSSQTALDKFFINKKTYVAPEGKEERMPYSGDTTEIMTEFIAGIKSALTYSGANSIKEFQEKSILRFY